MRGRAQHAEASGAADGRHHIAAMAESEQRKLDPQHVADRRFHRRYSRQIFLMIAGNASPSRCQPPSGLNMLPILRSGIFAALRMRPGCGLMVLPAMRSIVRRWRFIAPFATASLSLALLGCVRLLTMRSYTSIPREYLCCGFGTCALRLRREC